MVMFSINICVFLDEHYKYGAFILCFQKDKVIYMK